MVRISLAGGNDDEDDGDQGSRVSSADSDFDRGGRGRRSKRRSSSGRPRHREHKRSRRDRDRDESSSVSLGSRSRRVDEPSDGSVDDDDSDPAETERRILLEHAEYEAKYDADIARSAEERPPPQEAAQEPPQEAPQEAEAEADDIQIDQWVPMKARRHEFENHRAHEETDPVHRRYCARCRISATQAETARSDVIRTMDSIHSKNVGKVPPQQWAEHIQLYFYKYVRPLIKNAQDRVRPWYIAMIVDHYTMHVYSIEVVLRNQANTLNTLITYMVDHELMEMEAHSGRVRTAGAPKMKTLTMLMTEERKVMKFLEPIMNREIA